ncbi:MAG: glycosyltransferase [Proteobacteria bacterium]|nr:glycosyltransferase [Pseudomonadota bacterium]
MPRKRREEVAMIRHLVGLMRPDLAAVPWVEIDAMTHEQGMEILAASAVFLSLQRFEGFGLPAIEAMAAGCLVAGFPGVAISDYAQPDNGWWARDDDIEAAARAVCAALTAARDGTPSALARIEAGRVLAQSYSVPVRDAALLAFFESFLATAP